MIIFFQGKLQHLPFSVNKEDIKDMEKSLAELSYVVLRVSCLQENYEQRFQRDPCCFVILILLNLFIFIFINLYFLIHKCTRTDVPNY